MNTIDYFIESLDDAPRGPEARGRVIAGILQKLDDASPIKTQALLHYQRGDVSIYADELNSMCWAEFDDIVDREKFIRRLVMLMTSNESFDAYEAGFIVSWARELGVDEKSILAVFRETLSA